MKVFNLHSIYLFYHSRNILCLLPFCYCSSYTSGTAEFLFAWKSLGGFIKHAYSSLHPRPACKVISVYGSLGIFILTGSPGDWKSLLCHLTRLSSVSSTFLSPWNNCLCLESPQNSYLYFSLPVDLQQLCIYLSANVYGFCDKYSSYKYSTLPL